MRTWTIQKLLSWTTERLAAKAVDSPRLVAELLLGHVLAMQRVELYAGADQFVAQPEVEHLRQLADRACQGEPIAYLTGKIGFYSLQFHVTHDCMIPRPETELLVERAIEFLRGRTGQQLICDLCTGCGCIAVAIAENFAHARIVATDISEPALRVAAQNVEKYHLKDRIELLCGDLFEPVTTRLAGDKFDLIVCNPPYVSAAEYETLAKSVKDFEPKLALFGGADGLDICRRVIQEAGEYLMPDGALMLEIGFAQGQAIKSLLEQTGTFTEIRIEKDFQNHDRIAIAKKMSP